MSELSYTLATIPAAMSVVCIVVMLFKALTEAGLSRNQSAITIALALCSPLGKYIFVALPHALSAAMILYLVTRSYAEKDQSEKNLPLETTPLWDGFLIGLLPFIRYENTFLITSVRLTSPTTSLST